MSGARACPVGGRGSGAAELVSLHMSTYARDMGSLECLQCCQFCLRFIGDWMVRGESQWVKACMWVCAGVGMEAEASTPRRRFHYVRSDAAPVRRPWYLLSTTS